MAEAEAALNQEQTEQQEEQGGQAPPSFLDLMYPSDKPDEVVEEEEVETTDEAEVETESEVVEGEESEKEEAISSVAQLIEHLEADPEWFDSLKVPVKVDGKASEATLKELVSSYQIQEAATHRLEEAKAKSQALNQEVAQKTEELRADLGTAAGLVQLAEQLFMQDISAADLAKLREEDGERYLLEKDRFTERRNALEQVKAQLRGNVQKAFQEQGTQSESQTRELIQSEQAALFTAMPELAEPERRSALSSYLVNSQFTKEEIEGILDHRMFVVAEKARLWDESRAKVDTAKKRIVTVPKMMKPGAQQSAKPKIDKGDTASILYG